MLPALNKEDEYIDRISGLSSVDVSRRNWLYAQLMRYNVLLSSTSNSSII